MILDFQVGTSSKAHKILSNFAGRDTDSEGKSSKKDNPKAPFDKMADAYLFAFVLGLSKGEKQEVTSRKNYAHINSIQQGDVDLVALLRLLGDPKDLESKESAKTAIEEYATWGLLHLAEHHVIGNDDYRLGDLFETSS